MKFNCHPLTTTTNMIRQTLCLAILVALVVSGQELPAWIQNSISNITEFQNTNLKTDCGEEESLECFDHRINDIFVNLNRQYSPEPNYTTTTTVGHLNSEHYNSTTPIDIEAALVNIFNTSDAVYSETELAIIKTFPYRVLN